MDEQLARAVLAKWLDNDDRIYSLGAYVCWKKGEDEVVLDGGFTVTELEAIAWWVRNKNV